MLNMNITAIRLQQWVIFYVIDRGRSFPTPSTCCSCLGSPCEPQQTLRPPTNSAERFYCSGPTLYFIHYY